MKVNCLFFAVARERAGIDRLELSLEEGSTSNDAVRAILRLNPSLKDVVDHSRIACNGAFVEADAPLGDGDELAIIPPVSGG